MTAAAAPVEAWANRIVGHGEAAPGDLIPNPKNWRLHPKAQVDALEGVLGEVGWVQDVLVNRRSGRLVDGHARVASAIARGAATVPVTYVDLSDEEEALVLATLDPLSALAETDSAKFEELLASVAIDSAELVSFLARKGPKDGFTDPDAVPDVPEAPYVKSGELWALGQHRILCGDSTQADTYARVLGGGRADMCFTDPPWNVAIGQDSNPRHRQRVGLANDDLTATDFAAFLAAFAEHTVAILDGDLYCVLGAAEWPTLDLALRSAHLHWSATVIWVKDLFVLGRSKYHRRYEPVWYGWPGKTGSSFGTDRSLDDVWEIPRPRRSEEHPTMKPVELVERAIENSSRPGGSVLDPFLGSGTTIIAAERLGRYGYGIEIEPRYAQVAIERWQAFTGLRAERLDG